MMCALGGGGGRALRADGCGWRSFERCWSWCPTKERTWRGLDAATVPITALWCLGVGLAQCF